MLNSCTIYGRMTADPELKQTNTGTSVCSFSVACERDYKSEDGERETDFIDCVAWRHTAEFLTRYFRKGSAIIVSGRLQVRKWTDNDGNTRRSAEIVADDIYFGGDKKREETASTTGENGRPGSSAPTRDLKELERYGNVQYVDAGDYDESGLPF